VLVSAWAHAQSFPDRPITLICAYGVGASTDLAMRALAEAASKHLGQRIVVENKPGASGTIGPAYLARNAKPDGYVIGQMPLTVFRLPHMEKVNFDPVNDFTWIIGVTGYTFGVAVKADAPWKTFKDLIADARTKPGRISYASPGIATSLHVTMEDIARRDGLEWLHVPLREGGVNQLLGGHVNLHASSTQWGELMAAGRVRLLVTWGEKRTKRWPEVPTLKELGYDMVSVSPYGLAGPKGMDPKVVSVLHDAFRKAMDDPTYQQTIERVEQENWYLGSADYAKYAKETFAAERVTIERLGLRK
jgi:tripartite-type tricarboxylate transporter receptor subunit TctC